MSKRAWILPFLLVQALATVASAAPNSPTCVAIKAAGPLVSDPGATNDYEDAFKSATTSTKWLETPEAQPFKLHIAAPRSTAEMLIDMRQIRDAVAASTVFDGVNGARLKQRLSAELESLHRALAS